MILFLFLFYVFLGYIKPGLDTKDIEKYHKSVFDTYVEEWEPLLQAQKLTFRTVYLPLSRETANFLIVSYNEFERMEEKEKFDGEDESQTSVFDEWFNTKMQEDIGAALLAGLQDKMDECMRSFGFK